MTDLLDTEALLTAALHARARGETAAEPFALHAESGGAERRTTAWLSSALVAATVAAAVGVVTASHHTAPAAQPDRLTAAARSNPYHLPGGSYLKVTSGGYETWIPADPNGVWRLVSAHDENGKAINITARCGAFPGASFTQAFTFTPSPPGMNHGAHQTVRLAHPFVPGCDASGGWLTYRPQFAATLPTDPTALLARMRDDAIHTYTTEGLPRPSGTDLDQAVFDEAMTFLRHGYAPGAVVRTIVAALRKVSGVHATTGFGNGAGRTGTMIWRVTSTVTSTCLAATNRGATCTDRVATPRQPISGLLVDPRSGQVIGTSDVMLPVGTALTPQNAEIDRISYAVGQ